jgi:predicted ribosome quality control (RQC) complex YloA/Tae2 family protein
MSANASQKKNHEAANDLPWLAGLASEIAALGGRTVKVFRHARRHFVVIDAGGDLGFFADMTPGGAHVMILPPAGERPWRDESAEDWRQWGGRRTDSAGVASAQVMDGDRALCIRLEWRSRLGESLDTDIILELGVRQTNALLVNPDGIIVDTVRPVSGKVNKVRELLPGRLYVPPPSFDRWRVDQPWEWAQPPELTLREFFVHTAAAVSKTWAGEICHRCAIDPDTPIGEVSEQQRIELETCTRGMIEHPEPWFIGDTGHAGFEPTHLTLPVSLTTSFGDAATSIWRERRHSQVEKQKAEREAIILYQKIRKCERLETNLQKDLVKTEKSDAYHHTADLLMAYLSQVQPGTTELTVIDWFDPDQKEVTIRIDPAKPATAQADKLYQRSRKLRDSIPYLQKRLRKNGKELARLREIARDIEMPGKKKLAQEIMKEHDDRHSGKYNPRRYRTREGGWLLLVGRTEDENDYLSLRIAAQNDIWFHAHGCPGSHVVLKLEGRKDNPGRKTLEEAAAAAAYWSKARGSTRVPVSYTRAKHVTKPRGAKPGLVTIRREKLLVVPPALPPREDEVTLDDE